MLGLKLIHVIKKDPGNMISDRLVSVQVVKLNEIWKILIIFLQSLYNDLCTVNVSTNLFHVNVADVY